MWNANKQQAKSLLATKIASELHIKPLIFGSVLALTAILTGCGESASPVAESVLEVEHGVSDNSQQEQDTSAASEGSILIAMTDAEEDFVSYTINVNSVLLTRENGDQIEVMGEQTQVDFVEYQELTELFSIVKAPIGKYTSIVMELDYNQAYILIQDELGNSYEAQAVDDSEIPLTTYSVEFQLAESEQLEVKGNQLSQLTLDLDLSASNTILSYEPAVVQVEPFIIGSASIDEDREHRVRGTLANVDTDTNTVTVNLRPMSKKQGQFGEFDLTFTDESSIEIDGELVDLDTAIVNFSEQGEDFPLVAFGTVLIDEETEAKSLQVSQLLAGESVPWFGKDVFKGMVTDLMDGVSYVSGLAIDTDSLNKEHITDQVIVSNETTEFVSRTSDDLDASYLVPGQRIEALGQWTGTDAETVNFDASDETIRILLSNVMGQVTEINDEQIVTLDVSRFNKRPEKLVKRRHKNRNQNAEENTEIDDVLIDISSLTQTEVNVGDWIKAIGFVSPDSIIEGEVDMQAKALTKYEVSETEVTYTGFWGREGNTPIVTETGLELNVESGKHSMKYRFNPDNVMPELTTMTLVAGEESEQFAIRQKGEDTVFFDDYAEFLLALSEKLSAEETLNGLVAKGVLNEENAEFSLVSVAVKLN